MKVSLRTIEKCLNCQKEGGNLHPIKFGDLTTMYATYLCDKCFYKEIAQQFLTKEFEDGRHPS